MGFEGQPVAGPLLKSMPVPLPWTAGIQCISPAVSMARPSSLASVVWPSGGGDLHLEAAPQRAQRPFDLA